MPALNCNAALNLFCKSVLLIFKPSRTVFAYICRTPPELRAGKAPLLEPLFKTKLSVIPLL